MTPAAFVVDAHNDLLLELTHHKHEPNPFGARWGPKLRAGGVRLQVCPIFVERAHLPSALHRGLELCAAFHRALRDNPRDLQLVETNADLEHLRESDRVGIMLSIEGAEVLDQDPELLEVYWQLGVRMIGLTWNWSNVFAAGCGERPELGLTALGHKLIERAGELGMILDLAHASPGTMADALEAGYPGRVLVSHAGCRAVHETSRNLSDDQIAALAAAGGVLGIMALPFTVDPDRPTLQRLIDHVDHAVSIMGVQNVALGGDFVRQLVRSGATDLGPGSGSVRPQNLPPDGAIEGLEGPEHFANLAAALEARGYDRADVDAIMGANLLRLFFEALPSPEADRLDARTVSGIHRPQNPPVGTSGQSGNDA